MISRLPKWVWFGSGVLALIAGSINAIGFLGYQHQGLTHLTGTTTLLGISIASGDISNTLRLFANIGSFVLGCIFSGFLIQDSTLQLGRRYGVALFIESIMLCVAVPLLRNHHALGDYLASCACGLQNGMVSTYSGAVIRTSHVSGMFTDIGIFIGHLFRGIPVDGRRVKISLIVIICFLSGGILAAIGFNQFDYGVLYFPAFLTGVVGFTYGIYHHFYLR